MSSIPNEQAEKAHHLDDKSKGVIDAKQAFENWSRIKKNIQDTPIKSLMIQKVKMMKD